MFKKKLGLSAVIAFIILFSFNLNAVASTEEINNLFSNSGFEITMDGLPSMWDTTVWDEDSTVRFGVSSDIVKSGSTSAYINNVKDNDSRFYQIVTVEPNSYYKISAYIYAKNISGGDVGANIGFESITAHSESVFDTDGKWQQVVAYGKTGSTQEELEVDFRLGSYSSTVIGEAWFDDVSIEKVTTTPIGATVIDLSSSVGGGAENETTTTRAENVTDLDLYVTFIFIGALAMLLFFYMYTKTAKRERLSIEPKDEFLNVGIAIIIALFIRYMIAVMYGSHGNDLPTFEYWAYALGNNGLGNFYTGGFFADYPPGYMYILYAVGSFLKLFSVSMSSPVYALIVKSPAIICDIIIAMFIFKVARKKISANVSYMLMLAYIFNPAAIFNSAGWGQIDSVLTLVVVLSLYCFYKKKTILSIVIFAIAILIKPQALLFAPVAFAFLLSLFIKADKVERLKLVRDVLIGIAASAAAIFLLTMPFNSTQESGWLISKYISTASQYDYATLNAANLFGLIGANWANASDIFLFMSYKAWGTIFIALVSIVLVVYAIKYKPSVKHIFLIAGIYTFAVYVLGHYMHERYYFPLIVLLLLAYIMENDRRLLHVFILISTTLLINEGQTLALYPIPSTDIVYLACCATNVYALGWLSFLTYDITVRKKLVTFEEYVETVDDSSENEDLNMLEATERKGILNWMRKDTIIILVLTLVYASIAFYNLGDTKVPETYWRSRDVGDEVVLKLFSNTHIDELTYYSNVCGGNMEIQYSVDGKIYTTATTVDIQEGEIYKWNTVKLDMNATYIKIRTVEASVWLNEIGFYSDGEPVGGLSVVSQTAAEPYEGSDASNLIDEQSELSLYKTNMNGYYFDEIYHARTAYEHLNGLKPYEVSHPPLGKILISVGIAIFGMNPFGWRFMGTLFGVLMVPLMYAFAKRIFNGSSRYAFIATFLFAFDFMHFTQTRIATIDVYGVFFIILMYYYMYKYFVMSFNTTSLKKTFVPLFFCGLAFGLGSASKWICIYAGAGLAVLLFVALFQRYQEYKYAKEGLNTYTVDGGESELSLVKKNQYEQIVKSFKGNTIKTLAFCIPTFIIIPVAIYLLSYMPYMVNVEDPYSLQMIWQNQVFMFSYHSGLTQGHPYSSQWYEWPFMVRPVWYYKGEGQAEGMYSTIAAFGNPAVWYSALVGTVYAILAYALYWIKKEKELFFLIVALASQFLPWVLVTRATFLYHYFASLPFVILILVYVIQKKEEANKKFKYVTYGILILTAALFVVFYPAISGMPVSEKYIEYLRWLPSWWF